MTEYEKKQYNKEHYQKNRPIILDRRKSEYKTKKSSPKNVVDLFRSRATDSSQNGIVEPLGKRRWRIRPGTLFLLILVAANSYYLVTEIAQFYSSLDSSGPISEVHFSPAAYLRAFLLDGAVLSLTVSVRAKALLGRLSCGLLSILIYSYSIWIISNSAIQSSFRLQAQTALRQSQVSELELEIAKKTQWRDAYFQADRITLGSKLDRDLQSAQKVLTALREELAQSPNTAMIWNMLLTAIIFRLLVMASNLISLRELRRRYLLRLKTI